MATSLPSPYFSLIWPLTCPLPALPVALLGEKMRCLDMEGRREKGGKEGEKMPPLLSFLRRKQTKAQGQPGRQRKLCRWWGMFLPICGALCVSFIYINSFCGVIWFLGVFLYVNLCFYVSLWYVIASPSVALGCYYVYIYFLLLHFDPFLYIDFKCLE